MKFPALSPLSLLLSLSFFLTAGAAFGAFDPITREEAAQGMHVCLTGVVTCVAHWQQRSIVIASCDDPDGMAIYVTGEHPDGPGTPVPQGGFTIGDVIEVEGETTPLFFAPGISANRFSRVGHMDLPPPPKKRLADFEKGLLDNRRARLEGVVRSVRELGTNQVSFVLSTPDGNIEARGNISREDAERLVDAEVELSGIAMSLYNQRAEFLEPVFEMVGDDAVKILKAQPDDPFAAKEVALNATLSWRPGGYDAHRTRVRGTVTLSKTDGSFYLQSGDAALRVSSKSAPPVHTVVEVTGFPDIVDGVGQLTDALWRPLEEEPEEVCILELDADALAQLRYRADVTYIDYDCRIVSLVGRLYHVEQKDDGESVLYLESSGRSVRVTLQGAVPEWVRRETDLKPLIKVIGAARLALSSSSEASGRRPELSGLIIEANGPDALKLVPDAEWQRRRLHRGLLKILYVLSAAPLVFLVVLFFAWRKSVARRRKENLIAAERKRMADDLHDTIEQHLAGARILLSTALSSLPQGPSPVIKALNMAGEILNNAKREIRDVIMNLRREDMMGTSIKKLLAGFAAGLNARGVVKARTYLVRLDRDFHVAVKTDIMAIVAQAVTNAVSHGHAKTILILADATASGIVLRILNDGEPFDPAKALGPEAGHFGLANMRERAKRSGLAISWLREGRWMCVKLEVPE